MTWKTLQTRPGDVATKAAEYEESETSIDGFSIAAVGSNRIATLSFTGQTGAFGQSKFGEYRFGE